MSAKREFRVRVSERLWDKWLRHNPSYKAIGDSPDPGQTPDAAIMEALLATMLTSNILDSVKLPLADTSTNLMLAVGHVSVEEIQEQPED